MCRCPAADVLFSAVRSEFDHLLRDVTLTTLAFAIALGWSLFQAANGLGILIVGALQRTDGPGPGLSFALGRHLFVFEQLLVGLVELGAVLAVVLLVRRRTGTRRS
jgi:hypothetical protein